MDSPLFIIGTERSGSNLLRLILNTHSRITVPHPPHVVRYFAPIESAYGDLDRSDKAFTALVDDVLMLVRLHIYPWEFTIDRARILREASPRDTFGITVAIYEQYREQTCKARWGCKSTFMIDYVDRILARFPNSHLIFLTRDPRDVAVSSRRSVFNPFHPHFTAQLWARQQRTGLDLLQRLSSETILLVKYEDLVSQPESTVARICNFLGEEYEAEMLRYFDTAEARKSASLSKSWENTGRGILNANHGKYRRELSAAELDAIERVAHEEMQSLGYALEDPQALGPPSTLTVFRYTLVDRWRQFRVECESLVSDRNHWRRWLRDAFIAYLHVRRRPRRPMPGNSRDALRETAVLLQQRANSRGP